MEIFFLIVFLLFSAVPGLSMEASSARTDIAHSLFSVMPAASTERSSAGDDHDAPTATVSTEDEAPRRPPRRRESVEHALSKVHWESVLESLKNLDDTLGYVEVRIDHEDLTTLKSFVEGERRTSDEAIWFLEREMKKSLDEIAREEIAKRQSLTLYEAVGIAFSTKAIAENDVNKMMANALPLKAIEAMRLLENGIVHTDNGQIVELKTGDTFGDVFAIPETKKGADDEVNEVKEARKLVLIFNFQMFRALSASSNAKDGDFWKDHWQAIFSLKSPTAFLFSSFYFNSSSEPLPNFGFINPIGCAYAKFADFEDIGTNWWLLLSENYLGFGLGMSIFLENGALWSNEGNRFFRSSLKSDRWKEHLHSDLFAERGGPPALENRSPAIVAVSGNYDVVYQGKYPLDGKYAAIRGMHKLEIIDKHPHKGRLKAAMHHSSLVSSAFTALSHVTHRAYRTFRPIKDMPEAQNTTARAGIARTISQAIQNIEFPSFEEFDKLQVGDELIVITKGTLRGTFIFGLQKGTRLGVNISLKGEFELGLKRLPQRRYEVSIEPTWVMEVGGLESGLNLESIHVAKGIAFLKKQVFLFNFEKQEAREDYDNLVFNGVLPLGRSDDSLEGRSPEHMLARFRKENEALRNRGIQRIYLEKIDISTRKFFAGIPAANVLTLLPKKLNKRWEGLSFSYFSGKSKSVATDGITAVERITSGHKTTHSQVLSGTYSKNFFVTHQRIHTTEEGASKDSPANRWQFHSLVLHGRLEDTVTTGDQENKMADYINGLFHTHFGEFTCTNTKQPRTVDIERALTTTELKKLSFKEVFDRIAEAYEYTRVDYNKMVELVTDFDLLGPDEQALRLKHFLDEEGLEGFAAVHHLLGGSPEDLVVHTEGAYMKTINDVRTFAAEWANVDPNEQTRLTQVKAITGFKNRRKTRKFFKESKALLKSVDDQLRYLHDDQYFADENKRMFTVLGPETVQKLIKEGKRDDKSERREGLIAARLSLLDYLDFEKQGYSAPERLRLYEGAHEKDLRLFERAALLESKFAFEQLSADMQPRRIRKHLKEYWLLIDKIKNKILKLENDKVMKKMDPDFVAENLALLKKVQTRLLTQISIEHLSSAQLQSIFEKMKKRHLGPLNKVLGHREDYRIEGAFREKIIRKQNEEERLEEEEKEKEKSSEIEGEQSFKDNFFDIAAFQKGSGAEKPDGEK